MAAKKLTEPQRRLLARVRAQPAGKPLVQNGRARRTVEALEAAGLVAVEYDQIPQVKGNGIEIVERFYITPIQ